MNEQVQKIAEREIGGLMSDSRKELVVILRKQVLAEGSHLHCFLEWLDCKDTDVICIRQGLYAYNENQRAQHARRV